MAHSRRRAAACPKRHSSISSVFTALFGCPGAFGLAPCGPDLLQASATRSPFDAVGWLAEVRRELADSVEGGFSSPCREASELHILGHALAKWRHGVSLPGGKMAIGRPVQDAP